MSAGAGLSRQRSTTKRMKAVLPQLPVQNSEELYAEQDLDPCAATASLFLYAQGPTVVCLHHDTLAVERRFQKHTENVKLVSSDNVSERGAGRLVVSYDVGRTAIIWDLFTGEQLSRFASYESLTVASWMRNGNIAFGNLKGEVILFEPSSSDHISARTIFDPITALAPSADCKTYAIGYRNGSILLAALQPSFTILHTLTTSRAPSPITSLSWHASSSKQKSDMLATQTSDGDLRVWSIGKPPTAEGPRVIRVLKRSNEPQPPGRNWMSWAKNGRIVQFSQGVTWAWDVRTKHVSYEPVPTIEFVKAVAAHGSTGTLFTMGPDFTVQQYDLESGQMVANVRHAPNTIPPTPPPEDMKQLEYTTSESESDLLSPVSNGRRKSESAEPGRMERHKVPSPYGSSKNGPQPPSRSKMADLVSPGLRTERSVTTFSMGMQQSMPGGGMLSPGYTNYSVQSPVSARSVGGRKSSRLRQEVVMSPEQPPAQDLFPYTRARLNDVPYRQPRGLDESHLTPDDLRKQMLSVVFGWEQDIRELIHEEIANQELNTQNVILLLRWLDEDPQLLNTISSLALDAGLDWTVMALTALNGGTSGKKIAQVFVERALARNDIHAAATVLLACGDRSDAIEVYVSRNYYMEAILLTCLLSPGDWQRQAHLVRSWGEHVVKNSQQHLAIRCFACTGSEPTEPWTSPTARVTAHFEPVPDLQPSTYHAEQVVQQNDQVPAMQGPEAIHRWMDRRSVRDTSTPVAMPAPPTPFRMAAAGGKRLTPQTSALKLITSFGTKNDMYKYPGLKSDDRTPTVRTDITPIAESAISRSALSPGGAGSYRLNNVHSINSALSAKSNTPSIYGRHVLPSIGEAATEHETPALPPVSAPLAPKSLPTPNDSGSDKEREKLKVEALKIDTSAASNARFINGDKDQDQLLTSARYQPVGTPLRSEPQTAVAPKTVMKFPISLDSALNDLKGDLSRPQTGSRSRKPDGLSLQVQSIEQRRQDTERAAAEYGNLLRRPDTTDTVSTFETASDFTSPPHTGGSFKSIRSPASISGRSLDQYISSLEQAQYHSTNPRSKGPNQLLDSERRKGRKPSDDVGRRPIPAPKRSPSSPVPMSPEDLRLYNASVDSFGSVYHGNNNGNERSHTPSNRHERRRRSQSTGGKHRSRSRHAEGRSKPSSRGISRHATPDESGRGRADARKDTTPRSPSSPTPMVPSEEDRKYSAEDAMRFVNKNRERLHRSTSRKPERGTSARREASPDRRRRGRSQSRPTEDSYASRSQTDGGNEDSVRDYDVEAMYHQLDLERIADSQSRRYGSEVQSTNSPQPLQDRRKKELAAAELEARRLSLARRPSVGAIPFPGEGAHGRSASTGQTPPLSRAYTDSSFAMRANNTQQSELRPYETNVNTARGNSRAMVYPTQAEDFEYAENSDNIPMLASSAYRQPRDQSLSRARQDLIDPYDVPADMPKHPLFDQRIASVRSSSKGRGQRGESPRRGASRERPRTAPEESPPQPPSVFEQQGFNNGPPPILPELQHLAPPPPPPPPPAPPKDVPTTTLRVQTDMGTSTTPSIDPISAGGPGHRRGRSGGQSAPGQNQFLGKMKAMTDRIRSTSRGRDNLTRSPPMNEGGFPSAYETALPGVSLASVAEQA